MQFSTNLRTDHVGIILHDTATYRPVGKVLHRQNKKWTLRRHSMKLKILAEIYENLPSALFS